MPRFVKFYDANRTRKIYPLIRYKPVETKITNSSSGTANAEVAIVEFIDSNQETYEFKESYTQIPVTVISPTEDNVNVFITQLTTDEVVINSSHNFTGTVHLHIYESDWKLMSNFLLKEKVIIPSGVNEITLSHQEIISNKDIVINISSSKNLNIFITDINKINGTFKIKKSFEEEIEVYYVIIES